MLTISNFRFGGEARGPSDCVPLPALLKTLRECSLLRSHMRHPGITAIVNHAPYFCEEVSSALESQLCGRVNRSLPSSQPSFSSGMRGAEGSSIIIESSEFGGGCGNSSDPTACCAKINGCVVAGLYVGLVTCEPLKH